MDRAELIKQLDEVAELTPPICQYDKHYEIDIFEKTVTVYCKPFEQFQSLLKEAIAALREQSVTDCHQWMPLPEPPEVVSAKMQKGGANDGV